MSRVVAFHQIPYKFIVEEKKWSRKEITNAKGQERSGEIKRKAAKIYLGPRC